MKEKKEIKQLAKELYYQAKFGRIPVAIRPKNNKSKKILDETMNLLSKDPNFEFHQSGNDGLIILPKV